MASLTPEQRKWIEAYCSTLKESLMGRIASDKGTNKEFSLAPAGTHLARCYRLIDIGTRHSEYMGEPTTKNEVVFGWELCHETVDTEEGPKPAVCSKFYTNSLNEKANLRKDLEAWRGRPFTDDELKAFDLNAVLGKPCLLTIVHQANAEGRKKAKVFAVTGVPKGTVVPPQVNPSQSFWIDEWDEQVFEKLPDGFKRLITASDEFRVKFGVKQVTHNEEDFEPKKVNPNNLSHGFSDEELNSIPF
jgi:hypothetical protein